MEERKPYPSDVSDEEWAFVAPYLALVREDAPQRRHPLREVFTGLRYIVKTGGQWRWMPHDLRTLLRLAEGRRAQPTAAVLDSQTLQSTPESGGHAGYDGAKRRRGSKVHAAVDTLGHLLALYATPASAQDRAQVAELTRRV